MRIVLLCGALIAGACATTAVFAGTPYKEKVTCPIGGEKFTHTFTGSYSTYGSRPDGKPYGSWVFPMPIPVCPSNKLPIYDKFSEEQLAKLKPLIASPEFQAMAKDTPYYRAAWLMERIGGPAAEVAWMIVKASWEADADGALKRRYQEAYVAKLLSLPKNDELSEWLWLQARAANGLRELGRFPQSIALIEALVPQATQALEAVKRQQAGGSKSNNDEELESAKHLLTFLETLRTVAMNSNSSSEPVALLPRMVSESMCKENRDRLSASDKAACDQLPADDAS